MADQLGINKKQIMQKAEEMGIYDLWNDKNGVNFLKNNPQISKLK